MHFLMSFKYTSWIFIGLFVLSVFLYTFEYFPLIPKKNEIWQKFDFFINKPLGLEMAPGIPRKICNIRTYGSVEGTDTKSTEAIRLAIEDCYANGGGVVVIPKGKWLSGGIRLKSHIQLFLEDGAELVFSTDVKDYLPVVLTRFQGIEFYNFAPLIYTQDSQYVAITGTGKLIGNGDKRTDWDGGGEFGVARAKLHAMAEQGIPPEERIFGDNEPGLRPSFVQFVNSQDIFLDGFTIENGPIWTIHPIYVENFIARNLHINTWSGNTDGIVIDSSKNVIIEESVFSTGDDAVVIKSGLDKDGWRVGKPSENIQIRNITVTKGNSGVSIGSEMSGGVREVDIRDSIFQNTRHGFRIKSTKTRGGFIENIRVENMVMENVNSDILTIDFKYSSALQGDDIHLPILKNITLKNIRGSGSGRGDSVAVINIDGLSDLEMSNIRYENIAFISSARAVHLKNARNVSMENIQIESKSDPIYNIERSTNITIANSLCRADADPCFLFKGGSIKNIRLKGFDFSSVLTKFEMIGKVKEEEITII